MKYEGKINGIPVYSHPNCPDGMAYLMPHPEDCDVEITDDKVIITAHYDLRKISVFKNLAKQIGKYKFQPPRNNDDKTE